MGEGTVDVFSSIARFGFYSPGHTWLWYNWKMQIIKAFPGTVIDEPLGEEDLMMNFRAAATLGCSQRMKCSSGFRLPASLCPHMAGRRLRELWASLVAQMVKNLPAVRETRVQSLGREDPLEKEIATHSSILAWEIPCTEEAGRLQSMGSQRVECDCLTLSLLH